MQDPPQLTDYLGFFEWLYQRYGPRWTLALIIAIPIAALAFQIWRTARKEKDVSLALEEKERTIQRLAADNRLFRIQLFKEKLNWSDDQIERFMVKPELATAAEKKDTKKDRSRGKKR